MKNLALQIREVHHIAIDKPIVPTPAAAKYNPAGEPRPPAPMISTLAWDNFFCPLPPTSDKIMCRL
jgi:hypothetical protein